MKRYSDIERSIMNAKLNVRSSISSYNDKQHNLSLNNFFLEQDNASVDDRVKTVIDVLVKKYQRPTVKINVGDFYQAKELDSFFLGLPTYIEGDIPTNPSGVQFRILAQINCSQVKGIPNFPTSGLLQFWLADLYYNGPVIKDGKQISDGDTKDHSRDEKIKIIYIQNPSRNNINNVEIDKSLYDEWDEFPFIDKKKHSYEENIKITFDRVSSMNVHLGDYEFFIKCFEEEYEKIYHEKPDFSSIGLYRNKDPRIQALWDSRIGGFPSFTQNGIPNRKDNMELLLQMDSVTNKYMWGDCGIASFFIDKDDLKKKNFNNVIFYWDCY